jgi:hypothetical protein
MRSNWSSVGMPTKRRGFARNVAIRSQRLHASTDLGARHLVILLGKVVLKGQTFGMRNRHRLAHVGVSGVQAGTTRITPNQSPTARRTEKTLDYSSGSPNRAQ